MYMLCTPESVGSFLHHGIHGYARNMAEAVPMATKVIHLQV